MASDVSGVNGPAQLVTSTNQSAKSADTKQNATDSGPRPDVARDSVEITDTASQLRRLEAALENQPVVDQAKVDRLKAAVTEGKCQIDTTQLAGKLIDIESSIEKS